MRSDIIFLHGINSETFAVGCKNSSYVIITTTTILMAVVFLCDYYTANSIGNNLKTL